MLVGTRCLLAASLITLIATLPAQAGPFTFNPGDLVVSVEGDGSNTGTYTDNQAAPLTLFQYAVSGTSSASAAGSLELSQTTLGTQSAISGEYGSSSEGTLQLSGNGQYLTLMGYGVNAAAFNAAPGTFGGPAGNTALGQSGSSAVPRVVALVSANGTVDTSTTLPGVFDQNNPRSAYTIDGTNIYISGQGAGSDATAGVFLTTLGSHTATAITGLDTTGNTASQDTREVQIFNNTLYVSVDSKGGSNSARSFIGTLGSPPATSLYNGGSGPTMLPGYGNTGGTGKVTINGNGNGLNNGASINLSPENFFFANATTLYVADSGDPKNNSNCTSKTCITVGGNQLSIGDGGLQKWTLGSNGMWSLDYTLANGLNLVSNQTATSGSSGLYGLTGKVLSNGQVELYATNFTLTDTGQTFLYGITDTLGDTTASQVTGEMFTQLEIAPTDTTFKGLAFAPTAATPVPLPPSLALLLAGVMALAIGPRVRRRA